MKSALLLAFLVFTDPCWGQHMAVGTMFVSTQCVTITNTDQEAELISGLIGTRTIPARLLRPGSSIRIRASGLQSTGGRTTAIRFRIKLSDALIADTGFCELRKNTAGGAWSLDVVVTCCDAGEVGAVRAAGHLSLWNSIGDTVHGVGLVTSLPATISTLVPLVFTITAQWINAYPENVLTCPIASLELLS